MSLKEIKFLVLDDVDRSWIWVFLPDVRGSLRQSQQSDQTLLFSATCPPEIERLAAWVLRDPEF